METYPGISERQVRAVSDRRRYASWLEAVRSHGIDAGSTVASHDIGGRSMNNPYERPTFFTDRTIHPIDRVLVIAYPAAIFLLGVLVGLMVG